MGETTKLCPVCGNTNLVELRQYGTKVCVDHNPYVRIPWYLSENQKPLFEQAGGILAWTNEEE